MIRTLVFEKKTNEIFLKIFEEEDNENVIFLRLNAYLV